MKIDLPEKRELSEVFYLLKKRFLDALEVQDLILCLYILLNPRLGLRPIEITRAHREGRMLVVMSAKRRGRHERKVPLNGWPKGYLFAIDVLLSLVPRELDAHAFKLWRNALASKLARASTHTYKKRRLALYCCRHIAFASWREIGMSPQDIRVLAGHVGLTAQNAYGRGGKGFGARWLFHDLPQTADFRQVALSGPPHTLTPSDAAKDELHLQIGPDPLSTDDAATDACDTSTAHPNEGHRTEPASSSSPADNEPVPATGFLVEDMPTPTSRRSYNPPGMAPAEVRRRFDRLVDPRAPDEIVESLQQAGSSTGEHPAPKTGDSDEPTG